jgi:hypothetical protein
MPTHTCTTMLTDSHTAPYATFQFAFIFPSHEIPAKIKEYGELVKCHSGVCSIIFCVRVATYTCMRMISILQLVCITEKLCNPCDLQF